MSTLKKLDGILEKCENGIVIVTGIVVCLIIFGNAILRYLFKLDFYGNEEIILFFAFWLYFTGSSIAAKKRTHINADMVSMFTKNIKIINSFHLIRDVINMLMTIIASVWSCQYVMWSASMGAKSPVFKLPMLISQIPIMLSFFIWTCYAVRDLYKSIGVIRNGAALEKEED